jgi:Domain of unknown function (DUF4118)
VECVALKSCFLVNFAPFQGNRWLDLFPGLKPWAESFNRFRGKEPDHTGTGSMTVSLYTSPGRSAFGPQLTLFAYAVAVVAVSGAVVATLELGSVVKHTPTLFFCSVILSSWFGGVWPGVFAGLLSAIALDYYFIPPIYALSISLEEVPDMIAFVASASFVS